MSPEDEEITTKLENIEQMVNFIIIERNHLRTALLNISAERDQLRARVAEHDRALERACRLVMDRAWATGHASDAAELMAEVLRQADEVTAKAQARVAELERENVKFREHLLEIVTAAEANEFDSRMKYLEAQIGRGWLDEIKADIA